MILQIVEYCWISEFEWQEKGLKPLIIWTEKYMILQIVEYYWISEFERQEKGLKPLIIWTRKHADYHYCNFPKSEEEFILSLEEIVMW